MADERLQKAASILQQVDVTEIITSLALGIADAQEKLDNNSIQQLSRLSEQEVAGRSLLELGFIPAFYAFEYADVSASINLKMALKEKLNISLEAKANFFKDKGYTQKQFDQFEKSKLDTERTEYRSSRDIFTYANDAKVLKVGSETININNATGSVSKIETSKENLRNAQSIDRVYAKIISEHSIKKDSSASAKICIYNADGYSLLSMPDIKDEDWGLFKISDYSTNDNIAIDNTNGKVITLDTDLTTTMNSLNGFISAIGIEKNETINIYFEFDKDTIDFTFTNGAYTNINIQSKLRTLSLILRNDPSAKISITGHTDSSGQSKYNKDLGQRRANTLNNYLSALCVQASSITTTESKGEELANAAGENGVKNQKYRKVEISLTTSSDYIYLEGGDFSYNNSQAKTNFSTTPNANGILEKIEGTTTINYTLKFKNEQDVDIDAGNSTSLKSLIQHADITNKYYTEAIGEVYYLLHQEAQVHFTAFSKSTDSLEMVEETSSGASSADTESKMIIGEIMNKESILKQNASSIEDPSHFAISGSVDFRFATQFKVSAEGNAAVSARLIAVPPPSGFIDYINQLNNTNE